MNICARVRRPVGTTGEQKRQNKNVAVATMNEITKLYKDKMEKPRLGWHVVKGIMITMINHIKQERKLPPNLYFILTTVCQIYTQQNIRCTPGTHFSST